MSIASEITSMGENLKKDYQSIANLGADLTNVDKNIENIAELLDGVYDRLPKTEFEKGESVTLENTLKGKLDYENGVVGIGQTEQESRQGYNLIELKMATSVTNNGITYTRRTDGSVLVNGTASANSFCVLTRATNDLSTITTPLFTMSSNYYCTPQKDMASVYMMYKDTNGNYYDYTNVGGKSVGLVYLTVNNGVTINNLVVYPMIVNGSGTEKPYEPYTGGQASPNPSYPQEIKYVRGKNRFNGIYVNALTGGASPYPYTENNDCRSAIIKVEPNTTYTISKSTSNRFRISEYSTQPQVGANATNYIQAGDSETQYTLTTQSTTKYVLIQVTNQNEENVKLQLEEGTTSTPYLPYNTIEEVVRGKNLFDDSNHKNKDVPSSAGFYINNAPFNLSGGTYRFGVFVDNQLITTPALMALSFKSGGTTILEKNAPNQDITITDEQASIIDRVSLYFNGTFVSTYSGKKIIGVMITTSEITTYEPYITPTSYQLSLGDNKFYGIPNTNYRDELVYDVENDKVYKKARTIEQVVTSQYLSNLVVFQLQSINSYGIANFLLQNYPNAEEGPFGYDGLCNYLSKQETTIANTQIEGILYQPRNCYVRIKSTTASTTQEFADYVDSLNTSGNSLKIYRPIETPVLTEITDTTLHQQVKAWWNGQSLDGTTIIEGDGDLPLIIKCRGLKGE